MATTKINGAYQIKAASIPASVLNLTLDEISAPVASLDLNSQLIINLATPSSSTDAATKGYVDTAVTGLLDYKGVIDCSSNPNYPAASVGDTYVVSVAGKIGGASGLAVEAGDFIICNTDNAGGTQASVGADFNIIQVNLNGAVIGPASAVNNDFATFDGTTGKVIKDSGLSLSTDGTFTANSDVLIPSQKAVKTYVDTEIAAIPAAATPVLNEVPSGTVNGTNDTFTLANTPTAAGIVLSVNGLKLKVGAGNDYTLSGSTITFLTGAIPQSGDQLSAQYFY